MASVVELTVDPIEFEEDVKRRDNLAEATRHLYFIAARRIQAWIRGILTRNHFRLLHESAVIIQRHWRGHRTRITVDRYLIHRVHQMWQNYYDKMATKIQASWRGYWIRKTVLDTQKMQRWLNRVYAKNEETVNSMKRFKQEEMQFVETRIELESMHWILFILFKLHHLLRTEQRPGVITRIDDTRFTLIEEMLKCLEYKRYVRDKRTRLKSKRRDCQIDETTPTSILRGTYYDRCGKEIQETRENLKAGAVPIYRSEPYEEHEMNIRKLNQIYLEAFIDKAYETSSRREIDTKNDKREAACSSRKEFETEAHCTKKCADLCEKIKKMDCRLNEFRLKCPIHD